VIFGPGPQVYIADRVLQRLSPEFAIRAIWKLTLTCQVGWS